MDALKPRTPPQRPLHPVACGGSQLNAALKGLDSRLAARHSERIMGILRPPVGDGASSFISVYLDAELQIVGITSSRKSESIKPSCD